MMCKRLLVMTVICIFSISMCVCPSFSSNQGLENDVNVVELETSKDIQDVDENTDVIQIENDKMINNIDDDTLIEAVDNGTIVVADGVNEEEAEYICELFDAEGYEESANEKTK